MADSSTNIDELSQSQGGKEVTVNDFFDAASQATLFGRRASTSSGLTWGYYGGNIVDADGDYTAKVNSTLTLTASDTNYIVADKTTGAVSVSVSTTNWNDVDNYWRLYSVVTGTSTVTSWTDSRKSAFDASTVSGGGGGGGGSTIPRPNIPEQRLGQNAQFQKKTTTTDRTWHRVTWSQVFGKYFAVASSTSEKGMMSEDGHTWTETTMSGGGGNTWSDVFEVYGQGRVWAVQDNNGFLFYTEDGGATTWGNVNTGYASEWQSMAYSPTLDTLVVVGQTTSNRSIYSTDGGSTWNTNDISASYSWQRVIWDATNSVFIAVNTVGRFSTSADGQTWSSPSLINSPDTHTWRGLAYSAHLGMVVATAATGSSGANTIAYSTDAATWTIATKPNAEFWNGVAWNEKAGLFYVVGAGASFESILTSADGINWIAGTPGPELSTNAHNDVCYSVDRNEMCIVNSDGTLDRAEVQLGDEGAYLPVATGFSNVSSITSFAGQWHRQLNTVTFSCRIDVEATAAATNTVFFVPVPVLTGFATAEQVQGTWVSYYAATGASSTAICQANVSNNKIQVQYSSATNNVEVGRLHVTYRVD